MATEWRKGVKYMLAAVKQVEYACPMQRAQRFPVASWLCGHSAYSNGNDICFDYIRYSSAGKSQAFLRHTNSTNSLYLEFNPTVIWLRQWDGGVLTSLDSISTAVAEGTWYTVRAVVDGANVSVFWGEKGGDSTEILSTTSTTELTTTEAARFRASPNSEHGWDNVQLIADGRSTTQTFTYNDANEQITSTINGVTTDMTYDEWGRMTERDDGTHTATYTYRYGSKSYNVTSDFPGEGNVTYEYGGDGKRRSRVAGSEDTWYNYTIGFDVVSTEDDADGSTGALMMTNVVLAPWAPVSMTLGDLAGTTPASGTARYYATDHLGSTRSAWNASKTAVGTYEFTPYGSEYNHTGAGLASLAGAYTGKRWDDTAKLFHFPFRQYSPDMARWTNRDPLGMVDGPNVYAYTVGNPIRYSDRMGGWIVDWLLDILCRLTPGCGGVPSEDMGAAAIDCQCIALSEAANRATMELNDCLDAPDCVNSPRLQQLVDAEAEAKRREQECQSMSPTTGPLSGE